jgi:hypothetical protein
VGAKQPKAAVVTKKASTEKADKKEESSDEVTLNPGSLNPRP